MKDKCLANMLGHSGPHSRQYSRQYRNSSQELIKQQKEKAEVRLKHWLISWAKQRGTMSGEDDVLLQG